MKSYLKNNDINTKETEYINILLTKNSLYLSNEKWFKGSRSRGIR